MTSRQRNLFVGVVVLGALLALGWMILSFSSEGFANLLNKGLQITLVSDRVDGLSEGSPLLYLGVNVGHVSEVKRRSDSASVDVFAVITSAQPVPRNVVGAIRQQSQLGNSSQIVLESMGPPAAEPLKAGDVIQAKYAGGGMIPQEFKDLAAQARDQKLVEHLDDMVTSIRTQLETSGKLMNSLNSVVGDPNLQSDIKAMIAKLKQTSERLSDASNQLADLGTEAKSTLVQVRTTVGGAGERVDAVAKNVGDRLDQIAKLLEQFQAISTKINKGEGTAGQLVNDPKLYETMVDASKELNETIKALHRLAEQWEQEGVSIKAFK